MEYVECRVWSVKWGVESGECRVWSVKCKAWSVKCGVSQSATPAMQKDMSTSCDTSKRQVCATFPIGTATSASRGSRTSHTWNVTKCHACHTKQHEHIL